MDIVEVLINQLLLISRHILCRVELFVYSLGSAYILVQMRCVSQYRGESLDQSGHLFAGVEPKVFFLAVLSEYVDGVALVRNVVEIE